MDFDLHAAAILRLLIYPIQFEAEPVKGIDRVLAVVVDADYMMVSRTEFTDAIDAGLASNARLAELIPQSHPEATIRGYLEAVRSRLYTEL
jgi:hypothetical protein